jgi:predicted kinase
MMEVILLMGIPASGKSSFYQRRFSSTHLRINLDMLRNRHRERSLFEWCLSREQPCVIDDTNTTREVRSAWIKASLTAGVAVHGYFMQSRISDCLQRNQQRAERAKIPDAGVIHHHSRLELPSPDEGFASLQFVMMTATDFEVYPWTT